MSNIILSNPIWEKGFDKTLYFFENLVYKETKPIIIIKLKNKCMENLQQIRENYEKVYGRTSPVAEVCILQSRYIYDMPEYKGCHLSGDEITFMFTAPLSVDLDGLIEMQFRNRLSRKIAFMTDDCKLTVFISNNPEERSEYLTSAMILDTYFRREKP